MLQFLRRTLLVLFGLSTVASFGQATDQKEMDRLIVYGDDFAFGVKEPGGWKGDIENAKKYYCNIVFYQSKDGLDRSAALIQVLSFSKRDEKTQDDLAYDIKGYKDKYPGLKEKSLEVTHKDYKCYSKMVYVESDFYQYTVYINPGKKFKSGLSVAMNVSKREATEDELNAFKEIIASLLLMKG